MKKLIFSFLFLVAFAIGIIGCEKSISETNQSVHNNAQNVKPNNSTINVKLAEGPPRIKVKAKHTKKYTGGSSYPPPCGEPFWICVIFSSSAMNPGDVISIDERNDNIIAVELTLIDDQHLMLTPDDFITDESHIFKMTDDMTLDQVTASRLGLSNVIIKEGTYFLNPNEGQYGTVIVDISQ